MRKAIVRGSVVLTMRVAIGFSDGLKRNLTHLMGGATRVRFRVRVMIS